MSLRFLRSRYFSVASKRFLCTNAAPATPQPSPPSVTSPNRWNFLKYAAISALTGTTVLAGYASYGSFFSSFSCIFLESYWSGNDDLLYVENWLIFFVSDTFLFDCIVQLITWTKLMRKQSRFVNRLSILRLMELLLSMWVLMFNLLY
jgi:hypothetical protein